MSLLTQRPERPMCSQKGVHMTQGQGIRSGRLIMLKETAIVVLFLASRVAGRVTGRTVAVDGIPLWE